MRSDSKLYLNGPTYNGPTYNSRTNNNNGQANYFNTQNPSRFLNKSAVNQLQNNANKKVKKLSLSLSALIINLTNKNGYGARDA